MFGHWTYLVFELIWALPVVALQWAFGWRALWRSRRTVALSILLVTAYLSLADEIAIASGIWSLHADRISGFRFDKVPVEEILFFALTNTLVAESVVVFRELEPRALFRGFLSSFRFHLEETET